MTPEVGACFTERLLEWAALNGRSGLPWHPIEGRPPDPYRVWVSETMLQQTQLVTMLPYFERFLRQFPSCEALARAPLDEVLSAWSGLGYYARARNLHRAAQSIDLAGSFPESAAAWEALAGVGRSTAAAISAVVHQERVAILDGNVRRVLARQVCAPEPWASKALADRLWVEAAARLPLDSQQMPAYTQAIMDLGATVCLPRQPKCEACPVAAGCESRRLGRVEDFPVPRQPRVRPVRQAGWIVAWQAGRVALLQQPPKGVWGGLWVLPSWPLSSRWPKHAGVVRSFHHDFTHFRLEVSWVCVAIEPRDPLLTDFIQDPVGAGVDTASTPKVTWMQPDDAASRGLPKPVRRVLEVSQGLVARESGGEP